MSQGRLKKGLHERIKRLTGFSEYFGKFLRVSECFRGVAGVLLAVQVTLGIIR